MYDGHDPASWQSSHRMWICIIMTRPQPYPNQVCPAVCQATSFLGCQMCELISKLGAATTTKLLLTTQKFWPDSTATMALDLLWSDITAFLTLDLFLGREAHRRQRQSLLESVSPLENGFDDVSHMSPLCSSFLFRTPLLRLHPDFCCEAFCQIPRPGPPLGFYLIVVTEGVFITCVCVCVCLLYCVFDSVHYTTVCLHICILLSL